MSIVEQKNVIKLGPAFSPSTIISSEVFEGKEITISCGGGIGGSIWKEYTTSNFNLDNKFITIDTNKSLDTTINTNNIVAIVPKQIVKIIFRNDGNENFGTRGEINTIYFALNKNAKYEITNKYNSTNINDFRIDWDY